MRVFVTGATGFIGSAVVQELLGAGYEVLGLARSETAAQSITTAGATAHGGSLDDLESLRCGAADCDGVVHTAFIHDFSNLQASFEVDGRAIETLGDALAGSGRPLVVAAGTMAIAGGRVTTEDDDANPDFPRVSERAALATVSRGVRASVVRLSPTVHGEGDHGFVPMLVQVAREKGVSAYIGDGSNRWPAVHRLDAARLFRLALEKAEAGARLHAVAEEGIPTREIAAAIGRGLNLPVVSTPQEAANDQFGWIGMFFGADNVASSALTRERLGWNPTQLTLVADMEAHYFSPQLAAASADQSAP